MRALPVLLLLGACDAYVSQEDLESWRCDHWLAEQSWYLDEDRDGWGDLEAERADCERMELFVGQSGDCDDGDASRFPSNPELCQDGIDQDCDGEDPQRSTWYPDEDGDGYGDESAPQEACEPPEGAIAQGGDCDDDDAETNAGAADRTCGDGIDQDCDGRIECALTGSVDLSEGWSAYGLTRTLATGAPTGVAAGADVDGDGVADAAASGMAMGWLLGVGDDRADESTRLSVDLTDADDPGLRVAVVNNGALGAVALGSPDHVGDGGTGEGAVALCWSGDDENPGWITAPTDYLYTGAAVAAIDGTLAVSTEIEVLEELRTWHTTVTLLSGEAIPGSGETLRLDRAVSDAEVDVISALSRRRPVVALGADDEGLEIAVALLHDDDDEDEAKIYWFGGPLAGEVEAEDAGFAELFDEINLGSSLALVDLDGDGALDLALGSPDQEEVEVRLGPPERAGEDPDMVFEAQDVGPALANVGDVDGDGLDDLAVGAPNSDLAYLILGGSAAGGELEAEATILGPEGSQLGANLAGADVDGDGWSDLVLGAPGSYSIYVLWGGF